jgi:hypothetical protein
VEDGDEMADDARLRLDRFGRVDEDLAPAPFAVDALPTERTGTRLTLRRRAVRRPMAALALAILAACLAFPPLSSPSSAHDRTPGAATSARPVGTQTFRDPSSGAIVVAYARAG